MHSQLNKLRSRNVCNAGQQQQHKEQDDLQSPHHRPHHHHPHRVFVRNKWYHFDVCVGFCWATSTQLFELNLNDHILLYFGCNCKATTNCSFPLNWSPVFGLLNWNATNALENSSNANDLLYSLWPGLASPAETTSHQTCISWSVTEYAHCQVWCLFVGQPHCHIWYRIGDITDWIGLQINNNNNVAGENGGTHRDMVIEDDQHFVSPCGAWLQFQSIHSFTRLVIIPSQRCN